MELFEKIRLDVGLSDEYVNDALRTILESARTGNVDDGKVFVLPVEEVYRIRAGEEDAVTPELAGVG